MIIPFDQYQRYKNTQIIINNLMDKHSFSILEVGANSHLNLEKFIPEAEVTYLDIYIPPELTENSKYVLGDACDMLFDDNSFDIVVALDVFEHIPMDRRVDFINEISRVSKCFFIISAPFDFDYVQEAEIRINDAFKSLYKKDHPWLIEHIENKLPNLQETEDILNTANIEYKIFGHGDIDLWERIINVNIMTYDLKLSDNADCINEFYEKYMFENDYTTKSYRKFIIGSNNSFDIDFIKNENQKIEILNKFQNIENMYLNLFLSYTIENNLFNLKNAFFTDISRFENALSDHISGSMSKTENALSSHISGNISRAENALSSHISGNISRAENALSNHISGNISRAENALSSHISGNISRAENALSSHISGSMSKTENALSDHISGSMSKTENALSDHISGSMSKTENALSDHISGSMSRTENALSDHISGSISRSENALSDHISGTMSRTENALSDHISGTMSRTENALSDHISGTMSRTENALSSHISGSISRSENALSDHISGTMSRTENALSSHISGSISRSENALSDHISGNISRVENALSSHMSGSIARTENALSDHVSGSISRVENALSDHISGSISQSENKINNHITNIFENLSTGNSYIQIYIENNKMFNEDNAVIRKVNTTMSNGKVCEKFHITMENNDGCIRVDLINHESVLKINYINLYADNVLTEIKPCFSKNYINIDDVYLIDDDDPLMFITNLAAGNIELVINYEIIGSGIEIVEFCKKIFRQNKNETTQMHSTKHRIFRKLFRK